MFPHTLPAWGRNDRWTKVTLVPEFSMTGLCAPSSVRVIVGAWGLELVWTAFSYPDSKTTLALIWLKNFPRSVINLANRFFLAKKTPADMFCTSDLNLGQIWPSPAFDFIIFILDQTHIHDTFSCLVQIWHRLC